MRAQPVTVEQGDDLVEYGEAVVEAAKLSSANAQTDLHKPVVKDSGNSRLPWESLEKRR